MKRAPALQAGAGICCPNCGSDNSRSVDSRKAHNTIRRRKECADCLHRYSTFEISEMQFDVMQEILKRWALPQPGGRGVPKKRNSQKKGRLQTMFIIPEHRKQEVQDLRRAYSMREIGAMLNLTPNPDYVSIHPSTGGKTARPN